MSWRYPVFLDVRRRKCLVAGAGWSAVARVQGLVEAGAEVTLLASGATAELREMAVAGRIHWVRRDYQPGDLAGYFLAISTYQERFRNQAMWEEAQRANVLFNAVDDPAHCGFTFGAVVRRGDLQIAISTNGRCPALGVRLKQRLEREIGPEFGQLTALLGELRRQIIHRIPACSRRKRLWYKLVDSDVLDWIRAGQPARARKRMLALVSEEESDMRLDDVMEPFQTLDGDLLLRRVLELTDRPACVTCSFQAEDVAVVHMALRYRPSIPVLFLDTGYHFPETLTYRDRLAKSWNLNLVNIRPSASVPEQEAAFGRLHETDPGRCCALRKVEPLMKALESYDIWITGLRREQSPTRAQLQPVERHVLPSGKTVWKLNPLAAWKWNEVWSYLAVHEIAALPLYAQGYTSIGCAPCTGVPTDAGNPRSGRWGGRKLECGIHTVSEKL